MMMRSLLSTSRLTRSLLYRSPASFCVEWAPLDPRKHNVMNHNPHNMYLEVYEYGHYPEWVHISSVASRAYEPHVLTVLAQSLSARLVPPPIHRANRSLPSSSSPKRTGPGVASFQKT